MDKIRQGDIVSRNSYGNDILFVVAKILSTKKGDNIYLLKGLTVRIEADSPAQDLRKADKEMAKQNLKQLEGRLQRRKLAESQKRREKEEDKKRIRTPYVYTGKILHLDGDRRYTEKSIYYYKELGLHAIVKNVAENKQPLMVKKLLERYKPDILVITGHDALIKGAKDYQDVSNYRNSKYFAKTVTEARKWDIHNKLVIFAGACQSYFELLMASGANFASSPARVLIDFADPLIIAEKIATTDKFQYVTIEDLAGELRDGMKGIGGIGAKGKKELIIP